MKVSFLACILLLAVQQSASQDTVCVMTYNLLRYYPSDQLRDQYYRTVVQTADPDLLIVQEIDTAAAVLNFLTNVLNFGGSNNYSAGMFIDGYDSDNAIFFKTQKFAFVENKPIATRLRNISQFTMEHVASGRSIVVFGVHLKAGNTTTPEADSTRRSEEVDSLRRVTNSLPAGTDFLVVGDFNIYGSFESAYQKLIAVGGGNEGHVIDPLSMPGIWNDPAYMSFHTQSTRVRSFGYGATGGLDDRFDMILMSKAVRESGGVGFIPDSYRAFGNDGQHYNDSINRLPNGAVPDNAAEALHAASDHLPVVAEFVFDPAVGVERNVLPGKSFLTYNYPNPFNPTTSFELDVHERGLVVVKVFDFLGREVATLVDEDRNPGRYRIIWDASNMPTGVYFCRMISGSLTVTRRVLLMK